MNTIQSYKINSGENLVQMPANSHPLTISFRGFQLELYALSDSRILEVETRIFYCIQTGDGFEIQNHRLKYVGTAVMEFECETDPEYEDLNDGKKAFESWHLFECVKKG